MFNKTEAFNLKGALGIQTGISILFSQILILSSFIIKHAFEHFMLV